MNRGWSRTNVMAPDLTPKAGSKQNLAFRKQEKPKVQNNCGEIDGDRQMRELQTLIQDHYYYVVLYAANDG